MKYLFKNLRKINKPAQKSLPRLTPCLSTLRILGTLIVSGAFLAPQILLPPQPALADKAGVCAVPGKDGPGTISGIVNSYYPGATGATVAVGATSIPVGAINSAGSSTPIAAGDLLLIIQMQDAAINSTNTDAYGNGVGGDVVAPAGVTTAPPPLGASGSTSLNKAGRYEYAVATGPVSGGAIPISQGTVNSYSKSAATATQGQSTYQVVRVPQYSSGTITGTVTTSARWNGSSGGIVAFDVAGQLNLGGGTVDVNGLGFRGGGTNKNGVTNGGNAQTNYVNTDTGVGTGSDAPKGEGIAGTPRLVSQQPFGSFNVRSSTVTIDNGAQGYPNGDDGRGAPANAGGGGDEHNAGGGGGANGGNGGLGGRSYASNNGFGGSNYYVGGFGGTALTADPTRLVLGGGGGSGDVNDQDTPSGSGGGGGGMVFIRAGGVSGSATINARGANGIDSPATGGADAGGGGGAGGTALVTATSGSLAGLTINATGGVGGNLDEHGTSETDGPGAGGGGGAVYTTGGVTANVSGGAAGLIVNGTVNNNTSNGATAGTSGINQTVSAANLTTSISGSAGCVPQLTVTKTTSTPTTYAGGTATYTITVANAANRTSATQVDISDALPAGFTYASVGSVNLTGGATRTTTTNPSVGATNPSFGQFTIPGGGQVQITFTVNVVAGKPLGTYQNPATATYLDPTRTTTTGTTTATYNPASSTGEDVTVSPPPTVSGTVFSDANADVTINGSDAGTNAGSANLTIYAIDSAGKVVDKATVAANGTYTLANVPANSNVTLRLSNDSTVAIGATAPTTPSLPNNWVNTGENKNGTTETTTPGDIAITTTTVNITNQNFGIEQLPNTTDLNPASQTNPGGTTTVQVPTLAGTDPEDGALGSGKKFKIVTLPTNGTLTYNNTGVTAGQVISNYDPTLLKLDPQDGTITVSFTYAAVDAGGKEDPTPATVTIPFTAAACVKSAADGSYATSGKNKNSIWWLNFECYDEGIASTSAGQPFSFNLPDGSSMILAVKKTGPKPTTTTTLTTSPFSTFGTSSQYAGVPGRPAFYNSNDPASNFQDWTESLTTIVVKDKAGNIRNYTFVSADAENTNQVNDGFGNVGQEQLKFATNGTSWSLVELLSTTASPPTNTLTGLSSANATWTGNGNNNGSLIISTNNPTQVALSAAISGTPSRYYNTAQGGLFGIGMPKITLVKNINSRVSPTDQFTTEIAYTAPTVSLKTATSTGTATTFSTGAVSVLPGNIINLKETIAAGSTNPLTVYNSSIACTNVNATSTVLPTGTGTNFNITPQIGDDITCTITNSLLTISGTVFSDADADVTINGSDAGTNAGSANLTIYAIDTAGKVVAKATVAADGTYTLANVPANSNVTVRLSNDSTVAIGATAPTVSTIPSGWYYTGENKNGTVDGTIATLGNIALTTTTSNLTNENFGIRQPYTITADTAPTTCNPDYRTALNTGVTAAGGQVATGANDLNWTAEWIAGPASGIGTPYAPPRPVGVMPAVVVGNLAPGAWINEPANARWISYPFRLSANNNGDHRDADLDGNIGEDGSGIAIVGTSSDAVRLKFTSNVTLPSNASTIAISLPIGVSMDNQFISVKVNGVENLVPTPAPNSQTQDFRSLKNLNLTNGWQAGVNTIEVVMDSGPNLAGFFLGVQATSTQVCGKSNVVLVKRITAINGISTINPSDNTTHLDQVLDNPATPNDDATVKWPPGYLVGAFNAGKIKPGDVLEYTVYFLNAKGANANTVKICDRIIGSQTYKTGSLEIRLGNASSSISLSDAADPALDRGQFYPSSASAPAACNLITPGAGVADNGTWAVDVTGTGSSAQPDLTTMPSATAPGTPTASYGFIRFKTIVNP